MISLYTFYTYVYNMYTKHMMVSYYHCMVRLLVHVYCAHVGRVITWFASLRIIHVDDMRSWVGRVLALLLCTPCNASFTCVASCGRASCVVVRFVVINCRCASWAHVSLCHTTPWSLCCMLLSHICATMLTHHAYCVDCSAYGAQYLANVVPTMPKRAKRPRSDYTGLTGGQRQQLQYNSGAGASSSDGSRVGSHLVHVF